MAERKIKAIHLDDGRSAMVIIDQTKLPNEIQSLTLTTQEEIWNALYKLQVRGAPAIGIAAAFGLYLAAKGIHEESFEGFFREFHAAKEYLASARPTAVNLPWALNRMEQLVLNNSQETCDAIKVLLHKEAEAIMEEERLASKAIGELGLRLLQDGSGILTHCNAGELATVQYGTALAPIYLGTERGYSFKVFVDETRPLLQGARLTAFELIEQGIDTTVICDNMASQVMQKGWVQAVLVGSDRIAANGDACNKIGTSALAILAKHYNIPFYVLAPVSSIDLNTATGADIPIEERPQEEISEMWFKQRMTPKNVKVYNPAFDITDQELITAIVTDKAIIYPPYTENLCNQK